MKKEFHTYIQKAGEEISLTHAERTKMRGFLSEYMALKPVRTHTYAVSRNSHAWFFTFRPVAAVLVLALFVSSSGISYAAENALPGDILYPVKTHINEKISVALARTPSEKSAVAMALAGKRIKEAATLAAEGRLSSSTQADLQASFSASAQEAAQQIAVVASTSPAEGSETAVRFEAQLAEYDTVLGQIASEKQIDVAPLTQAVKKEGGHIADVRTRAESRITSADGKLSAAASMRIAARAQLDTSRSLAQAVSKSLSPSSAALVSMQLDTASTTIAVGDNLPDRDSPDSRAISIFQGALSTSEKIGVYLKTSSAIHDRTGLVVAEPNKKTGAEGVRRAAKTIERPRAAATLMKVMPVSATTTATSSEEATGTVDVTVPASGEEQRHEDSQDSGGRVHQDVPSLPISVPLQIGL